MIQQKLQKNTTWERSRADLRAIIFHVLFISSVHESSSSPKFFLLPNISRQLVFMRVGWRVQSSKITRQANAKKFRMIFFTDKTEVDKNLIAFNQKIEAEFNVRTKVNYILLGFKMFYLCFWQQCPQFINKWL